MMQRKWAFTAFKATMSSLCLAAIVSAEPYELSKNDLTDPKAIASPEISLFGVKLGDEEGKALDVLVNEKIPGIKAEQEATFIFLLDQRKPTGPMAGVRVQDGKVDLIFINNRFAYKTRGIFRNVLNSESPDDVRKLLGKEDYGDENVMGAMLSYDRQGFQVNYLGKDVNVEFSHPH
jgi:D-amino peptidase